MDYQVLPIQLSFPELESKPNPNIMTERLTKYYVAEENPNEGNFSTNLYRKASSSVDHGRPSRPCWLQISSIKTVVKISR
jgi:hypothetical protein